MKHNIDTTYEYLHNLQACINCSYEDTCNDILFPDDLCCKCSKYQMSDKWIKEVLNEVVNK